jgi:tripartite ATP-independent transporter DctP family solute receptor
MSTKKAGLALSVLVVGLVVLTGCAKKEAGGSNYPTPEKPITLKMGYDPPSKEITDLAANEFKRMVEERTQGAVKLELYPQNQLGSMKAMLDNLLQGTLEMDLAPWNVLTTVMPEFNVMTLPYNIDSVELYWDVVGTDEFKEKINEVVGKKGLVFLGVPNGVARGLMTKKPIRLPSDLKGQKIRIMDGPIYQDMFGIWGAGTSVISFAEVYTALQQGIIDGLDNTPGMGVLMKFFEVTKSYTATGHLIHGCPMFINKTYWDKLSPEQQGIMKQAAKEMEVFSEQTNIGIEEDFLIQGTNNFGINVINLTSEDIKTWVTVSQPVYEKYRKEIGEEFYTWFMKYVDSKRF